MLRTGLSGVLGHALVGLGRAVVRGTGPIRTAHAGDDVVRVDRQGRHGRFAA